MTRNDFWFDAVSLLLCVGLSMMIALQALAADTPAPALEDEVAALENSLDDLEAELMILEEDLLFPASGRVAVFLSVDVGELFSLDSVTLELNGEQVTSHLYTARQREALARGGVQKLFVGNVRQGNNRLTAFFHGIGPHERAYKRATTLSFEHDFEPVMIELNISDSNATRQPEFVARAY